MVPAPESMIEVNVDSAPDWDDEAMAEAERKIREYEGWDDEAAEYLKSVLWAAQEKQRRTRPKPWDLPQVHRTRSTRPYDPMRLYARCMRVYQGLHPELIDEMHYKTFFGLCREAIIQQEEEEAEFERKYGKNNKVVEQDPAYVRQQFNGDTAVQYGGPVVRKKSKVDYPPEQG